MKINVRKIYIPMLCLLLTWSVMCSLLGCTGPASGENAEDINGDGDTVILKADLNKIVDPPLLKKVGMYNAGCIQPLSNYDRDLERIRELNADALRIDLSIGKGDGTGGRYLVKKLGDDGYEYNSDGTYNIKLDKLEYDFSQLDRIVALMEENGVLPYMSWSYIPYPLQENGKWNDLDQNVANWQEAWEEIYYQYAKHYADNGVKIGYHEIYNEPDLEILKCWGVFDKGFDGFLNWYDFCLGEKCAPGEGVYPDMYEYGVRGILRADPDATIGGPAFALGEIGVEGWVGFLPRVKSAGLPLDFYSFHSYLDGDTWFRSEETRASSGGNEIEKVIAGLASDSYYLKTSVHINEFSYLNSGNGANDGLQSPFNYYASSAETLNALMEIIDRTSVQWVYWAQFMESTAGNEPYGLIEHNSGHVKAPFNALKIYADMPVWRYDGAFSKNNKGLETLVSADENKISILIWNNGPDVDGSGAGSSDDTNNNDQVRVKITGASFPEGTRRVYRIDEKHGSWFDDESAEELKAEDVSKVKTDGTVWEGTVPAQGVVYITVNKNPDASNFDSNSERQAPGNDIKTQYYYEDRFRGLKGSREYWDDVKEGINGSYAHFDRGTWTMFLGMGDSAGNGAGSYKGQANANGAVICDSLPNKLKVSVKTEGGVSMNDVNSTLGMRVDYYDKAEGKYSKSVYFYYDGLYNESRNPNDQETCLKNLEFYPWGTNQKPDSAVNMTGNVWDIDLRTYAPGGWSEGDRVQISFDMRNTGAHTRAQFRIYV